MEQLYLICAVAGGTFLGLQFLMLLVGIGGGDADVDVGGDVDMDIGDPSGDYSVDSGEGASAAAATHSFQVISTKTLTAFFTFFGLGGRLGGEMEMLTLPRLAVAVGCGLVAVFVVAYLWSMLMRLQSHGNVDVRRAVGTVGRVYLRIPGEETGHGKVTVTIQGRTVELLATTTEAEIATGSEVEVVALVGKATVKVVPVGSA